MSRVPVPSLRLSLMTSDGRVLRLSDPEEKRCEGVFLDKVPDGLWIEDRNHQFSQAMGQVGGTWGGQSRSQKQFELLLVIKGRDVNRWIDELGDMIGDGEERFSLVARHPRLGWHWLAVRIAGMSEVVYTAKHPAYNATARVKLLVVADRPLWSRPYDRYEYTAAQISDGVITFPIDGTEPVWPELEIRGSWSSMKIRLDEASPWQELPPDRKGWRIGTDPRRRIVETIDGATEYRGLVPHWPMPIRGERTGTNRRRGRIFVQVQRPSSDFQIVVKITAERTRAW
ncbi:hypothetical protein FRC0505_00515 [Corynebacterium diphtheriae]|nr:hypothetical protein FRC0505_00515 [Corynebacterium diphtheriae]